MNSVVSLHSKPRTGAVEVDMPDVLSVALVRLRQCRADTLDVLVLADQLPEMILPALAWAASRKPFIARVSVQTLVKYCGPHFLERCLGKSNARELALKYRNAPQVVSGL
ncbi:MAG: hypothetical protein ACMG51_00505 [Ginsengibacter sp.]